MSLISHFLIVPSFFLADCRDLKNYQDTIVSFGLPALSERFEFLRQLGNVFLVRPDILKSYITENYLGRIEPSLLRPYLAQRSDWAQFERAFDFGEEDGGEGNPNSNGNGNGDIASTRPAFRERLSAVNVSNRLSTMMHDLEGMRIGGPSLLSIQEAMSSMNEMGRLHLQPMGARVSSAVGSYGGQSGAGAASPGSGTGNGHGA